MYPHFVAVQFELMNLNLDIETGATKVIPHICSSSMHEAVFAWGFGARQDCSVLIIKGCLHLLFS